MSLPVDASNEIFSQFSGCPGGRGEVCQRDPTCREEYLSWAEPRGFSKDKLLQDMEAYCRGGTTQSGTS